MDRPLALCLAVAVATLALVAIGLIVALVARRGRRVDDHPTCRRCRFDLTGLPADRDRCPECGADLRRCRATLVGTRAPRPLLMSAGVAMTLLALTGGGLATLRLGRAVDWPAAVPTWWLLRQTRLSDPAARAAALDVLAARANARALTAKDELSLIDAALTAQTDPKIVWTPTWGDVIARRIVDGTLDAARRDAYVAAMLATASLQVRPDVRAGDPLPMAISFDFIGRTSSPLLALSLGGSDARRVTIDGRAVVGMERSSNLTVGLLNCGISDRLACAASETAALAPGEHVVEVRAVARLMAENVGDTPHDRREIAQLPYRVRTTFKSRPADAKAVEWITDESARPVIELALRASTVQVEETDDGAASIDLQVAQLPLPVAFRITLRQDERSWPVGTLVTRGPQVWGSTRRFPGLVPGKADLIFTADPSAAAATIDVTRAWQGDVITRDVPVTAYVPRSRPTSLPAATSRVAGPR